MILKGRAMRKGQKTSRLPGTRSTRPVKASRGGSQSRAASAARTTGIVTPTSERIINETFVKRRKAMKVLANR